MSSPAVAIAWQIWRPNRWLLSAELVYLLLAAVISPLLPAIVSRTPLGEAQVPTAVVYLCFPLVLIVTHWLGAFALASADGKHFGFPSHMFVLPVRALALAFWPMLYGCTALSCLWWFIACLILRPVGIVAPLFWPAATLSTLLTMLQALSWTPFTQNWLRLVLAGPVLAVPAVILLLMPFGFPEVHVAGVLLGLAALSFGVSVMSVARGRRGDSVDWRLAGRILEWATVSRAPSSHPFPSRAAAQVWFECRGHAWALPAFVAVVIFLPTIGLIWHAGDASYGWRMLGVVLFVPVLIAGFIGGTLGRQDAWSKFEMTSFLATRPVTAAALFRAKLEMAAISAAAAWLIVLPVIGMFLLQLGMLGSLREVAQAAGYGKMLSAALAILAAAVVMTWLNLVQNMWLSLTGRAWLLNIAILLGAAMFLVGGAVGFWIYLHPAWYPAVTAAVPWLLTCLLLLKLVVAVSVLAALDRWRLVARGWLAAFVGIWGLAVAGLCLAAYFYLPSEQFPLTTAAAAFAIGIPFSRLAVAPLALAWNRHR